MTRGKKSFGSRPRKLALAAAAVAVFGLGVFAAWMDTKQEKGPRLVLVGMDALTWDILSPLLEQNKLPHFQQLIDKGVHGPLLTLRSTYISASIWTSILTGKRPEKHGIKGFFTTRGYTANATYRKTKFLPQILGEQGIKTAAVGFWATWPADQVNGFIVSDVASYGRFKDSNPEANRNQLDYTYLRNIKGVTWPEDLVEEILPVMLNPDQVPRKVYEKVLPMSDPEWETFKKIVSVSREDLLSLIKFAVVTDLNFHRAGMEIIRRHHPDAYLVYFQGPDIMEHFFWKFMDPADFFPDLTEDKIKRFGKVIESYYIFMDELLGETLKAAGKDAFIIVCSDHGMKRVRYWGQDGLHSGEHRLSKPPGVYIMAGPGVKKEPDQMISGPSVLDITPTILYALSLPVGEDMDGEVRLELFTDEFKNNHKLKTIPTYDHDFKEKEKLLSPHAREYRQRLRALGYAD